MGDSSAILAVNSLDRYINVTTGVDSVIEVTWLLATPNILTLVSGVALLNATLFYDPGVNGWPAAGIVTITAINGAQITINQAVTANSGGVIGLVQTQIVSSANQPTSNSLFAQWSDLKPYSYNFTIQSPGALIYGYIDRIVVSQIQLQYNIPTVCVGRNDTFVLEWANNLEEVEIPHGFYYADELAATIEALLAVAPFNVLNMDVEFVPRDGFVFTSGNNTNFSFPGPGFLVAAGYTQLEITKVLKTYRLLGITIQNSETTNQHIQTSYDYPNFLYTPYIDIYSDVLTNYQNIKDTNTSVSKYKGLVARLYVSGTGQIQVTGSTSALGTAPFVMTSDLNTPKVIKWSPDVAIPSIDFQLFDCYGEYIPGAEEGHSTEFQMTLLCMEPS